MKSGKVLNVPGASKNKGTEIQQFQKHNGPNQSFKLVDAGNGYFKVQAKHSGLYWDIQGANNKNGQKLTQYTHHGGANQQFKFEPAGNGEYKIKAKHSGKYLDVAGGATWNGAKVQQWDGHGGPNQRWRMRKVGVAKRPSPQKVCQGGTCLKPLHFSENVSEIMALKTFSEI